MVFSQIWTGNNNNSTSLAEATSLIESNSPSLTSIWYSTFTSRPAGPTSPICSNKRILSRRLLRIPLTPIKNGQDPLCMYSSLYASLILKNAKKWMLPFIFTIQIAQNRIDDLERTQFSSISAPKKDLHKSSDTTDITLNVIQYPHILEWWLVSFHVVSSWYSPLRSACNVLGPSPFPLQSNGTPLERTGWRFSREGMYPNMPQLCLFKRFILQDAKNTGHFLFSTSQNRDGNFWELSYFALL